MLYPEPGASLPPIGGRKRKQVSSVGVGVLDDVENQQPNLMLCGDLGTWAPLPPIRGKKRQRGKRSVS